MQASATLHSWHIPVQASAIFKGRLTKTQAGGTIEGCLEGGTNKGLCDGTFHEICGSFLVTFAACRLDFPEDGSCTALGSCVGDGTPHLSYRHTCSHW